MKLLNQRLTKDCTLPELLQKKSYSMCIAYSEDADKLAELLDKIEVSTRFGKIDNHFADDKETRPCVNVLIKRGDNEISFDFGFSIKDKENINQSYGVRNQKKINEFKTGMLYSILACCSCDYWCEEDFDYWCSDYGYTFDNEREYIKVKSIHHKCLDQSRKLKKIFSESEIDCLPR